MTSTRPIDRAPRQSAEAPEAIFTAHTETAAKTVVRSLVVEALSAFERHHGRFPAPSEMPLIVAAAIEGATEIARGPAGGAQ